MKIKLLSCVSMLTVLSWWACKNNDSSVEKVQEIRPPASGGSNSELVRNPISADAPLDTQKMARIVFEQPEFDFGKVEEGQEVKHVFTFKNTGAVPLLISNARASCGCTVPEWSKDPIPPGGTGEIIAKFNTEGRLEHQRKVITVTSNAYPAETEIVLHGYVKPKKK